MAELSNGSVIVRYGETVVMVKCNSIKRTKRRNRLFPTISGLRRKINAVGKIPGSFKKKENQQTKQY